MSLLPHYLQPRHYGIICVNAIVPYVMVPLVRKWINLTINVTASLLFCECLF